MKARYRWVVEARNSATGMWSLVFKGNQPDMNRFLAKRNLGIGLSRHVQIRKRRVLRKSFFGKPKEGEGSSESPRLWKE